MPLVNRLHRVQTLPIGLPQAWAFFSDPRNLADITPGDMGFRILSEPPSRIYEGLMIPYAVTPFPGIKLSWLTEITHVREPEYFVDEQRIGPYRLWHHEHRFRPSPGGGVVVEDIIHYALPFGWPGRLAAGALVRSRLDSIFRFRAGVLAERFGEA
jgi:ligand-binding SRPBCC domain-containing protein